MSYVNKKIADILSQKFMIGREKVTENAHLANDLGIDSLDYALFIQELENMFEINISETEAARMQTIERVVDYIEYKISVFSLFR